MKCSQLLLTSGISINGVIYGCWQSFCVKYKLLKHFQIISIKFDQVSPGFHAISWKIQYHGYLELWSMVWQCYSRFCVMLVHSIMEQYCIRVTIFIAWSFLSTPLSTTLMMVAKLCAYTNDLDLVASYSEFPYLLQT